MSDRRDSRTDEQRRADDDREREFHRERARAGLPPLHYGAEFTVYMRDVVDDEVDAIRVALDGAAVQIASQLEEARPTGERGRLSALQRGPYFSGASSRV